MYEVFPYYGFLLPGLVPTNRGIIAATGPSERQELVSPTPRVGGVFGTGVALSVSTDELFVGEPGAVGSIFVVGRVRYYTRIDANSAWTFDHSFLATGNEVNGHQFGSALDYNGTDVLVGTPNDTPDGSVFTFTDSGGTWTLDQEIQPGHGGASGGDKFGIGLALSGSHALIGAPQNDNGSTADGIVEYWEKVTGTWTYRSSLSSSVTTSSQNFGHGIAMADDSTAYISRIVDADTMTIEKWTRSGTTWSFASDWDTALGSSSGSIRSMDSNGTDIAISFHLFENPAGPDTDAGRVIIYSQNGAIIHEIDDDPVVAEEEFGYGVAIDSGEMVVGSRPYSDTHAQQGKVTHWTGL